MCTAILTGSIPCAGPDVMSFSKGKVQVETPSPGNKRKIEPNEYIKQKKNKRKTKDKH